MGEVTGVGAGPARWSVSVTARGRIKTTGGLVAYIDGRRAWPWRRISIGEPHHIQARNRRTPRDLLNVARGHADRLRVALDAKFTSRPAAERNLISRTPPGNYVEPGLKWQPYVVTPEQIEAVHRWTAQHASDGKAMWERPKRLVRFTPLVREDVKAEAVPWIDGEPFEVECVGTMDDGTYEGQTMWAPVRDQPGPRVGWLPDCDLTDVQSTRS